MQRLLQSSPGCRIDVFWQTGNLPWTASAVPNQESRPTAAAADFVTGVKVAVFCRKPMLAANEWATISEMAALLRLTVAFDPQTRPLLK